MNVLPPQRAKARLDLETMYTSSPASVGLRRRLDVLNVLCLGAVMTYIANHLLANLIHLVSFGLALAAPPRHLQSTSQFPHPLQCIVSFQSEQFMMCGNCFGERCIGLYIVLCVFSVSQIPMGYSPRKEPLGRFLIPFASEVRIDCYHHLQVLAWNPGRLIG